MSARTFKLTTVGILGYVYTRFVFAQAKTARLPNPKAHQSLVPR